MRPSCLLLAVSSLFVLSRMCHGVSDNQCPAQEPFYGKALKGYTFKTFLSSSSFECLYHCHYETRCQSYNYVIKDNICEMNNRTKEAKPEQFVSDPDRFYKKRGQHRVTLGSTPALPADSCEEIKASEGEDAVSGNWWLDPTGSGEVMLAHCDMNTGAADFCIRHRCQNGATCVNGHVNYTCLCNGEWTGTNCESTVTIPLGSIPELPAVSCDEIKLSEGEQAVSGNWWLGPTSSGEVILAYCDMDTGVADFCVQPLCQNGATCVNNEINYTCTCGLLWTGAYCESMLPDELQNSTILKEFGSPVYFDDLTRFLQPVIQGFSSYRWVTCYHALTDGWEFATAHSKCDNKGPTVTIVRVNNYIFGAFTGVSWISRPCGYSADSQAFIFSLYNGTQGYQPVKLTQTGQFLSRAVYRCDDRFITFGSGDDLLVSYPDSHTVPRAYTPPAGCPLGTQCPVFAGTSPFKTSDVEVFYLVSS